MAVRGDELASVIEAQIRQAVERLAVDIHSSIEDVQKAVNQQLEAAVQSVKADVNRITFRAEINKAIEEHQDLFTSAAAPAAAASTVSGPSIDQVKRAIGEIERGKSQVDVLNALLEQCLRFGSRAALLILKGDVYNGWKGVGFAASGGNDEAVKRFTAPPNTIPEFDRVLRQEEVVRWEGTSFTARLGVRTSESAVLVPMVIKDKVAAAMYVDRVEGDAKPFDPSAIELLVFTTGLLIDTLAIRKKIPSPSLSRVEDEGNATMLQVPPAAAPRPPAAAPQPPARPTPPPVATPPRPFAPQQPASPAMADATIAFNPADLGFGLAPAPVPPPRPAAPPQPAAPRSFELDTSAPMTSFDAPVIAPPPAPKAPAPSTQVQPPAAKAAGAEGDKPSTQYVPPAGLQRTGFGAQPQTEEAKKHDEARRFARLLVSEIKLYNEAKVEQGRKNRDVYERMKDDIDRSRQMYDDRIPESVRLQSNYFYDELVRILAEGDAEILGL